MAVTIRPFTEPDVTAAGDIAHAMQPPYLAEEGMTSEEITWPEY